MNDYCSYTMTHSDVHWNHWKCTRPGHSCSSSTKQNKPEAFGVMDLQTGKWRNFTQEERRERGLT